jgi:hypothetical protein
LNPPQIATGTQWLTLQFKNIGTRTLTGLDVRLHSFDTYSISVLGTGRYISALAPNEERLLTFQVSATSSARLYVSVDGRQGGASFHWESPYIPVVVGQEVAKLVSVFAMTEPYPALGQRINVEATVRSLAQAEGLRIELWVDTPGEKFEELAAVEAKALAPGQTATYATEIIPEEPGLYTLYAYLYQDGERLDRETEVVYVRGRINT